MPRKPDGGVMELMIIGGAVTRNVTLLDVPLGEVTVTFRFDIVAFAAIVNVAVTVVELATLTLLTVTPVPEMLTPVTLFRAVPVRVTGTAVPVWPAAGAMEVRTGLTIGDSNAP